MNLGPEGFDAYKAHLDADEAWMDEIGRTYPHEWAGDVRFTPRAHGEPGTPLAVAYELYLSTRTAWERFLPGNERSAA